MKCAGYMIRQLLLLERRDGDVMNRNINSRSDRRGARGVMFWVKRGAVVGLWVVLVLGSVGAAQDTSDGALPLAAPESSRTRAELLGLLDQVQGEIEGIPANASGAQAERLASLNGLLQLLLLQTQLERLQRENTTLQTQVTAEAQEPTGSGEVAALEARLDEVIREQQALAQEMTKFSTDHASLLTSVVGTTEETETESATEAETHTIVEGDSLSRLAQTYLGSANRWPEFLEANPDLTDADNLIVGVDLVIPPSN